MAALINECIDEFTSNETSKVSPVFDTRLGVPIDEHLPVTTMQEQMLIHQLLQPDSALSHMLLVLPLERHCSESVARASLHAPVQRHASLRTIYVQIDDRFE